MRYARAMAVLAAVLGVATVASAAPFLATDNFDSYVAGSAVHGQGGWSQSNGGSGTNDYRTVGGGGAGGTNGINNCPSGSYQLNWTDYAWSWADLAVGDKAIAKMDFQTDSSGNFDDDRIGWVMTSNADSSSYHFGVQLDRSDAGGGLVTYFRTMTGSNIKNLLIAKATLGATANSWYREELYVTKLTDTLGPNGAQLDVYFSALDASGNVVGTPLTATTTIDTSIYRGFSTSVYPMFKNYNAIGGNADNAYFQVTPEPASMGLLALGGLALLRRRRK